jgi:hypothetical protein
MKTSIFLDDCELDIIECALQEYEEKHYASESDKWQQKINTLIDTIKKRGVREI